MRAARPYTVLYDEKAVLNANRGQPLAIYTRRVRLFRALGPVKAIAVRSAQALAEVGDCCSLCHRCCARGQPEHFLFTRLRETLQTRLTTDVAGGHEKHSALL